MTLSSNATKALDALDVQLAGLGYRSHHQSQDYRKPIRIFIERYEAGERLSPDDVRDWAISRDWLEPDARDLGEMALTVDQTMQELRQRG